MTDVIVETYSHSEHIRKRRKLEFPSTTTSLHKIVYQAHQTHQRDQVNSTSVEQVHLTLLEHQDQGYNDTVPENVDVSNSLASSLSEQMNQDNSASFQDCPCGFLHGPGQGHHHDKQAVGLSSFPLLRGPD